MKFRLNTEKIECDIDTKDKYCFISGFSGVGKSLFVSEVESMLDIEDTESLMSDYKINVILSKTSLEHIVDTNTPVVYVVDEFLAHDVLRLIQNKNCYLIAVTRKVYSDYNFSDRCLYIAMREGSKTKILKRTFIQESTVIPKVDKVVVEDSGAGLEFYKKLFKGSMIISAGGKSNLNSKLKTDVKINESVLVIFDRGGDASVIDRLMTRFERYSNIYVLMPECFEHVLLCSKFIGYQNDILQAFDVRYNDTENYCEVMLMNETKDKPFEYNHEKQELSKCWYDDCYTCDKKCKYKLVGEKIELVLCNGPIAVLLKKSIGKTKNSLLSIANNIGEYRNV